LREVAATGLERTQISFRDFEATYSPEVSIRNRSIQQVDRQVEMSGAQIIDGATIVGSA
jgi:hypothetical protein